MVMKIHSISREISIINSVMLNYLMVCGVILCVTYIISWNLQGQQCKMSKKKNCSQLHIRLFVRNNYVVAVSFYS